MHNSTSEPATIRRLTELIATKVIWAGLVLADAADWAIAFVSGRLRVPARSTAQGLVEWSLAAAVLAFVGIAAWQLAGTAITGAVNRTIGSLNRAGA
jgi:hypothetical protein